MSRAEHPDHKRAGRFFLAGLIYIAGVLLYSLWSYNAHHSALLAHMDRAMFDAAYTLQEILPQEDLAALSSTLKGSRPPRARNHQSLVRLATRGTFSSVGVLLIDNGTITPLAAEAGTHPEFIENTPDSPSISSRLQTRLLQMSEGGSNTAELFDDTHPVGYTLRYAVLYEALNEDRGLAFFVSQERKIINQAMAKQILRLSAAGIGLLVLAIPLILVATQSQKKTAAELSELNTRLQHDVELQKTREEELKDAISDLQRFNAVTAGRESRIIELKAEVNVLLEKLGREKRYNIEKTD